MCAKAHFITLRCTFFFFNFFFLRLWLRSCARLFKIAHRDFSAIQRGTFRKLSPCIPLKVLRRKLFCRVGEWAARITTMCQNLWDGRRAGETCHFVQRSTSLMNKRLYYALRRRFEASGVNVICGDLGENWHSGGTDVPFDGILGDFFHFERGWGKLTGRQKAAPGG